MGRSGSSSLNSFTVVPNQHEVVIKRLVHKVKRNTQLVLNVITSKLFNKLNCLSN